MLPSCRASTPSMDRFAGYDVLGDLLRKPMLPLEIDWYVTCLDLGAFGAV